MLKINFEAESGFDTLNPINVACALINHNQRCGKEVFTKIDLKQIAEHLLVYCNHNSEDNEE